MPSSKIITTSFQSKALLNNPLDDPDVRRVMVYLPPGYRENESGFPSVYLLAGFTGRGTMMMNDNLWEENIQQRIDRLIESKSVRSMIIVLPDASTRYGGSQYVNSSATGNYEDHILELVDYIDQNFNTIPDSAFRAVSGKSSGGYGATMLGMKHPDLFGYIADHSGDKYFDLCYMPDFPKFLRYYSQVGMDGIQNLLQDPASVRPKSGDFFSALNILAMASCYSPNPNSELGFDLPLNPETGETDQEVWAKWKKQDPVNLIETFKQNLKSLRLLFFDCGTRDEFNLHYGARIFANRLKSHAIQFIHKEFDDGHRNLNYRYDVSLAAISNAMGKGARI